MATKANLISAINAQLTAIITQAKVRLASSLIVDEIYPTTYYENYNETSNVLVVTNFSQVGVRYIVSFKKVGNTVFYSGNVFNNTSEIKSGYFIQIVNSEFLPQTDKNFWTSASGGQRIEIAGDYFDFEAVGASENTYFSGHYTTNN
jgi:hypothetical protein